MFKCRTLFSGIGSPEVSLKNIGVKYELTDFCEIDKYAIQSYCAIHGVSPDKNLGDISKVWGRNLPYADLLVWGFPCTDISVAGHGKGIIEGGTRSGLYYEGFRILKETKPKYSIIENVKNLVGKKFKEEFKQMLEDIEGLGYNNYWKVLNAKDYGIPQNRERVFIVSIRKDVDDGKFEFPIGYDNGLRLKDFLEDEVEEKYYIAPEKTERLISQLKNGEITKMNTNPSGRGMNGNVNTSDMANTITVNKGEGQKVCVPCITPDRVEKRQNGRRFKEDGDTMFTLTGQDRHGILEIAKLNENRHSSAQNSVLSTEGICTTIDTMQGGNRQPKVLTESVRLGGIFDGEVKHQAGAIWDKEGLCPTLDTMQGGYRQPSTILNNFRIRKLTPKECWRLMGFSDEEFQKAQDAGVSNSQLYKQAGNSIVTNVLAAIFTNLLQVEIKANTDKEKIVG